ncbi:MAG: hypothetical protein ABI085_16945 [Gemmatimonadaceae bacterium]
MRVLCVGRHQFLSGHLAMPIIAVSLTRPPTEALLREGGGVADSCTSPRLTPRTHAAFWLKFDRRLPE